MSFTISMYAVGFPGMTDLVVQLQYFIVNKVEDGRYLTKSNKICAKHFFYHFRQNRRRFMTLVSTIEFSSTHRLVALSRNHFRHFRFQKSKWRPSDKQNRQQKRRSRRPNWVPHGSYGKRREHISLSYGNNTTSLSWPSGGHFVCLMPAILVYRLSKIKFASHRGVYMKIPHVVRES